MDVRSCRARDHIARRAQGRTLRTRWAAALSLFLPARTEAWMASWSCWRLYASGSNAYKTEYGWTEGQTMGRIRRTIQC